MKNSEAITKKPINWDGVRSDLDQRGFVVVPRVLTKEMCGEIAAYYGDDRRFRSRIEMSRYSFGQGEYKYFNYPLPPLCSSLEFLSILSSRRSPIAGQNNLTKAEGGIRKLCRSFSKDAIARVKSAQHHCF